MSADNGFRATKALKKNVTIEIRLPDATKSAFVRQCRAENRTASETLRALIDQKLTTANAPLRRTPLWRVMVAWSLGLALGAGIAAPSLAHSTQSSRPAFERLDRNHDGQISRSEYRAISG